MELRSCSHLHFIQAIKGGSITKILNVARGRPTLSFKNVTEIYGSSMFDNNDIKVERLCISEMEKIPVKTEPEVSVCKANGGDDEEKSDLEDCAFGNLTLKQIQDRCKTKKRKSSQGLDASERKIKIEASSSLEHCSENHRTADDSELMETLSSWRSKSSKNKKAKKTTCIKDPVSTITHEIKSIVKSEVTQNSQELPTSSVDSVALVEVKSEAPEIDCSDNLRMLCNISNNFQANEWPEDSLQIVPIGDPESARECMPDNEFGYEWREHADIIPLQMVWTISKDILATDSEPSRNRSLNFPAIEFDSEECIVQPALHLISPGTINLEEDQNTNIYYKQLDGDALVTLPITIEGLHCVDLDNGGDDAFFSDCNKNEFTSDAEVQTNISSISERAFNPDGCQDCSSDDSPESKEKQLSASVNADEQRHVIETEISSISERAFNPNGFQDCSSDDSPESKEKQSSASVNVDEQRHVIETEISSISERTFNPDGCRDCSLDDSPESKEKLSSASVNVDEQRHVIETEISSISERTFNPDGCQDCSSDDSPEPKEKQLSASVNVDEQRHVIETEISSISERTFNPDGCQDCSSDDSPESEEKKVFATVNVDEQRRIIEAANELISWDGYKASSKLHRPQRLLSARKAISPSSQIRLCKAMQSIDLHDKDYMKCRGKLNFDEQTEDEKKGSTEGITEITRAQFTKRCNKISMIPKPFKRVSPPQGVQKSSNPSRSAARLGSGHTSMQSCAKRAISFSKRQMQDAEFLAMKLTNELKSMKDIMDDMLRSELCLTTSLRYKVNEARMAVKNATKAEETAKRSLSIMSRDCSRFCKLMQLADEGPPASQGVVVPKKSKKIAFADEAGGRLCQVRFYEDEEGSLLENDTKEKLS